MIDDYRQPSFYKFNEDSTFLAKFILKKIKSKSIENILEVGIGSGIISLEILSEINSFSLLKGVEKEIAFKNYLEFNINRWHVESSSKEDIEIIYKDFLSTELEECSFDLIYFNPPYFFEGEGRPSPDSKKEGCRRMKKVEFINWLEYSSKLLRDGGSLFFCHRFDYWCSNDFNLQSQEQITKEGATFFHWQKCE